MVNKPPDIGYTVSRSRRVREAVLPDFLLFTTYNHALNAGGVLLRSAGEWYNMATEPVRADHVQRLFALGALNPFIVESFAIQNAS